MLKIGGFYDFQISFRQNEKKKQNNPQADITAIFRSSETAPSCPVNPANGGSPIMENRLTRSAPVVYGRVSARPDKDVVAAKYSP